MPKTIAEGHVDVHFFADNDNSENFNSLWKFNFELLPV